MVKEIVTCGALAVVGLGVYSQYPSRSIGTSPQRSSVSPRSENDAHVDESSLPWQSQGNRIFAQGRVEGATPQSELRPAVTGRVERLYVADGERVDHGQPLLSVESSRCERQVELAARELQIAQARFQRLQNGPSEHERMEMEALLLAKTAQLDLQKALRQRMAALLEAKAVTQQEGDDQEARLAALAAETAAAQARLNHLASEPREDDLAVAAADVDAARARLELVRAELEQHTLRSPIRGQILHMAAELGEVVGPQAPEPSITVADTSHTRIRAYVEELDAPRVKVGMPTVVRADGLPQQEWSGRVSYLSPQMSAKQLWSDRPAERQDAKTREAVIELDAPTDDLVVGLRVDLFIDADAQPVLPP